MPGFSLYDTQMGINIYINENYIPMGFTYDNYISQDEYDSLTKNERAYALLNYIVLNEEQIEKHKDILDYSSCYVSTFYDDFENSVWERTLGSAYYFDYDNTGFTSKIELEEENLVFFSVPYEKGWSAYVNGEKAEIEKVNVGFMAVRVPAGDNEIRFEYFTPGLKIGLVGTAVGSLALIAYVALHILSLRKQRLSIAIEDDKQLRATLDSPDIIPAGYEDDEDELFGETLRHLRSSTVSDSDTIYPADDPSKPKEGGFAVVDALPDTSEEFISVDDLDLDALDDDYSEYSELMLPEAEEDAEQVSNEYTHKWINDDKNKE